MLALLTSGQCAQPHVFVIGGEAFPLSLARELQTRFPNAQIFNHYGPTETVVGCAIFDVTAAGNSAVSSRLPIGQAMANHELYVLNEANQLAPVGVPGELCIGGAGVAKGYVKQPELTAAKFIANPFGDGRLYKSGDVVRLLPSGDVEFLGRVDDQVKIRGFRIEPGEIESVLKQTVSDALVVVQGEEEHKALVAYVVGPNVDLDALKARVKKALPDYMVPAAWCVLDAFPLNANGKIDRKALPAVDRQVAVAYVAPNNETEERLAQIWQDVLKLKTPPSITANFFDLGGHSLLATRLASQISIAFKCRVPLQAFFQYQDVRTLADFIDGVQWMNVSASAEADHYEDEVTL
jgi:acyl-CoA synthetase (AMP-forming)/AMP-acid ligase II/acyl carrier protein